jgi:2-polyprenyl-3-methyl-5-hydroxy-6-metoxy-1,4-benzoquinol methylase
MRRLVVTFTSHNIRLDDGTYTKPDADYPMEAHPWFLAARRVIDATFPGDKSKLSLIDLGCLEGGYTVEFARLGLQALGLDVREANIEAARYVQSKVNLPNLKFVVDNVWDAEKHGSFDVTFCCGLYYHVDKPVELMRLLSRLTKRVLFLQTHFSEAKDSPAFIHPRKLRRAIGKIIPLKRTATTTHKLSRLTMNEGVPGRWLGEFRNERAWRDRKNRRWASWENRRSFWVQREYLLQIMRDAGFDLVFEQYDALGSQIAEEMITGSYRTSGRSTFVGIKTSYASTGAAPAAPAALRRE